MDKKNDLTSDLTDLIGILEINSNVFWEFVNTAEARHDFDEMSAFICKGYIESVKDAISGLKIAIAELAKVSEGN